MTRWASFGVMSVLIVCAGCGPRNNPIFEKTVPVRGSVVLANGKILTGGQVTFHPRDASKGEARAMIRKDGRFELGTYKVNDGAMPGTYTVTVEPMVFDGNGNPRPARYLGIPPQYSDAKASTLTVEVKDEGDQDLRLQLR
jgi:hypothetical protein